MSEDLVSVVVPVYNTGLYLERCLNSLIHQTYRDLEIICVNDGSTDDSARVLDAYAAKDSRIKVIHQKNAGAAVARNRGLDRANGRYVTFVDSDDWVEPEAYSLAVAEMADGVDLVCFGTHVDGMHSEQYRDVLVKHLTMHPRKRARLTPELQVELGGEMGNKLYRREIVESAEVRFPVGLAYGEDKVFHFRYASQAATVTCLPVKLYHYYQREGSAMSRYGSIRHPEKMALLVLENVRKYYAEHGVNEAEMKPVLALLYEEYLMSALPCMPEQDREHAYRMGVEMGVMRLLHRPAGLELKQQFLPRWERRFHWYAQNRQCFGLMGRSVWSVTYEPSRKVYRLLGHRVWTSYNKKWL